MLQAARATEIHRDPIYRRRGAGDVRPTVAIEIGGGDDVEGGFQDHVRRIKEEGSERSMLASEATHVPASERAAVRKISSLLPPAVSVQIRGLLRSDTSFCLLPYPFCLAGCLFLSLLFVAKRDHRIDVRGMARRQER